MAKPGRKPRISIERTGDATIYTRAPTKNLFISTGCTILDCILGGGWVLGKITNLVGDSATSKTSLCTETVANFLRQYPDGAALYRETEFAFDYSYAESLGMPLERVDFGDPDKPVVTVEDFARDLGSFVGKRLATKTPGIYVLDSLDALSDEAELSRDIGEGSYGTKKAAKMSELLRTSASKLEQAKVLLLIVSQVRANIGVTYGDKQTRSGGKALQFYSSQVVWLARVKNLKKIINKVERPYGIIVKATVKKNKVAPPYREAEFPFLYYYGTDDLQASINWLKSVNRLPNELKDIDLSKLTNSEHRKLTAQAAEIVKQNWNEIEGTFLPKRRKYGDDSDIKIVDNFNEESIIIEDETEE